MKAGNVPYEDLSQISDVIPVFPLSGALLLPGGQLPLNIFEPRYLRMIEDAMSGDKLIGIIQPCLKGGMIEDNVPALSTIGCIGRLTTFQETGDGRYLIGLSGICRFNMLEEIQVNTEYRQCRVNPIGDDLKENEFMDKIDRPAVIAAFRKFLTANNIEADWDSVAETDSVTLVNALCMMSPYGPAEKQVLLESKDICDRAEKLVAISEFHLAAGGNEEPTNLN